MDVISTYKDLLCGKRKRLPLGFWDKDCGGYDRFRVLLQYVVVEKRRWSKSELLQLDHLDHFFKECKLKAGIVMLFNGNAHEAIIHSFPDWDLKPWQFGGRRTWSREVHIQALTWFMVEYCKNDHETIAENLTLKGLEEAGIEAIAIHYRCNIQRMMEELFPNRDFSFIQQRKFRDHARGERHPFSTLTNDVVREMKKRRRDENLTAKQLSSLYGTSLSQAQQIIANRTWKHIVI